MVLVTLSRSCTRSVTEGMLALCCSFCYKYPFVIAKTPAVSASLVMRFGRLVCIRNVFCVSLSFSSYFPPLMFSRGIFGWSF
jgi:hypothetical protein